MLAKPRFDREVKVNSEMGYCTTEDMSIVHAFGSAEIRQQTYE